jgi:anti-anti-sigma factor
MAVDTPRLDGYRGLVVVNGVLAVSVENWSEDILVVELQDDPAFSDDVTAVIDQVDGHKDVDVVLNLAGVNYLNSSNIAKLLKLRKKLHARKRRLVLCGIDTNVWGLFLVTGLDNVFDFADNVAMGLAGVQLDPE